MQMVNGWQEQVAGKWGFLFFARALGLVEDEGR